MTGQWTEAKVLQVLIGRVKAKRGQRQVACTVELGAGTYVTCSRCQHMETTDGDSEASAKAAFVLLRESCPRRQKNFYYDEQELIEEAKDLIMAERLKEYDKQYGYYEPKADYLKKWREIRG